MEWRVGSVMGGCGRKGRWGAGYGGGGTHINTGFIYRQPPPPTPNQENEGGGGLKTFVFMHTLIRLNGKGQKQIGTGRAESGSSGWGPQIGFVPIWEFVAVHAFIMKLNEARKCLVGHGQNTAPLMFSWQIWRERETILDLEVSNRNTERRNFWFPQTVLLQDLSDKSDNSHATVFLLDTVHQPEVGSRKVQIVGF